ncbi:MAG TPA: hypothetical protein VNT75_10705 [Symbiobacteriaceae bacterium]|nr:hypothetical protein [Symbiobacteriaceae bacterium]
MSASVLRIPRVFDRYMLPKVAFGVITGASMAGAALTGLRHGIDAWPLLVLRWAAAWVLALLLGSQIWKVFYLRPSVALRPVPGAVEYGVAMLGLHVRWQKALAPLVAALVGGTFAYYFVTRPAAAVWSLGGGVALIVALIGIGLSWVTPQSATKQDFATYLALAGLAGTAAALGGMDAALQPSAASIWLLAPNRMLHLWAFSAWLGGALWNIFIAVPAGMQRINMDTVILANFQLERFRVVVRLVFPVIVATGLVQAWAMFGWNWEALFTNIWGYLVLTKVGLIGLLVGIFIACPMWKACSPIRGVCDLDDL